MSGRETARNTIVDHQRLNVPLKMPGTVWSNANETGQWAFARASSPSCDAKFPKSQKVVEGWRSVTLSIPSKHFKTKDAYENFS